MTGIAMHRRSNSRYARLYLFCSLLRIPNSPLSWEIAGKKIWLKQPKAASALDFPYFQHASKLVTHDKKVLKSYDFRTFSLSRNPVVRQAATGFLAY